MTGGDDGERSYGMQALHVGFVGVGYGVAVPGMELFWSLVHLRGGPAPVRRFLPELIDLIWTRQIDPGKVFDLRLPLDEAQAGHEAMDQRTATKCCCIRSGRIRRLSHPWLAGRVDTRRGGASREEAQRRVS
jgi:hypothetical protein